MYVVIEGIIGAGKSTLAEKLARRIDAIYYSEEFETNPCLQKFYSNSDKYARCTEVFFLNQRYEDLKNIQRILNDGGKVISDFGFFKGMAFSNINLNSTDLINYTREYKRFDQNLPKADLTVFLDAKPEWALQNIINRNRAMELKIQLDYLNKLSLSYQRILNEDRNSSLYTVSSEILADLSPDELIEKIEADITERFPKSQSTK